MAEVRQTRLQAAMTLLSLTKTGRNVCVYACMYICFKNFSFVVFDMTEAVFYTNLYFNDKMFSLR